MKIGLFDLYTTGHHLPYASRMRDALEQVSGHQVDFVTLSETDHCTTYFDEEDIVYVDDPASPRIEDRGPNFDEIADSIVEGFLLDDPRPSYDVIHFLYADDIFGPLWRHARDNGGPRLIGEVNGGFFHRGTFLHRGYRHRAYLGVLSSPLRGVIDWLVPERSPHPTLWRDLYLQRCLTADTFDAIVTHSKEATDYVDGLHLPSTTRIDPIPYPAPEEFGLGISRQAAREQLDLSEDQQILLFFGTLKRMKGIHLLLDALRDYRGPEFTMLLAGPPATVTEQEVQSVIDEATIDVIAHLGFVDRPEMYYRASDAVILPYTRTFGRECTSQTYEEVCSALRPVIVPNFGVLGRLTTEWNLGTTFEVESTNAILDVMSEFARNGVPFSKRQMKQYNREHSFESVAEELLDVYDV